MSAFSREAWVELRECREPGSLERGTIETLSDFEESRRALVNDLSADKQAGAQANREKASEIGVTEQQLDDIQRVIGSLLGVTVYTPRDNVEVVNSGNVFLAHSDRIFLQDLPPIVGVPTEQESLNTWKRLTIMETAIVRANEYKEPVVTHDGENAILILKSSDVRAERDFASGNLKYVEGSIRVRWVETFYPETNEPSSVAYYKYLSGQFLLKDGDPKLKILITQQSDSAFEVSACQGSGRVWKDSRNPNHRESAELSSFVS